MADEHDISRGSGDGEVRLDETVAPAPSRRFALTRLATIRKHRALRYVTFAFAVAATILAAAVVSSVTVDLGPVIRGYAERYASDQLQRPVHIGSLAIRVVFGRIELGDFSITGLHPEDRPFFSARRLSVALDWSTLVRRHPEFTISSVEMDDWQMLVEKWPDEDNFPKLKPSDKPPSPDRESRVKTTLRYLRASRGRFAYEDHEAPWEISAPNIELTITKRAQYEGTLSTRGGRVTIHDYLPMWTNMQAAFVIDGGKIQLHRIDLDSDGARTVAAGEVDVAHWPEMRYQVKSRLQFARMREIFFARESWRLSGDADFDGIFHLFKHGHDLSGTFKSELGGVNTYRFPLLYGSLHWTRELLDIWNAGSKFYSGSATYAFSIKPLGDEHVNAVERFEATYTGVDLAQFTDFEQWAGLRVSGTASGHNILEWPSGEFKEHRGEGQMTVTAPPGVQTLRASDRTTRGRPDEWGPFGPSPLPEHLPMSGEMSYRFDPAAVRVESGQFATERTHVAFQGSTAWGDASQLQFHVATSDWQHSQQLLAGILTDFGSPTGPVSFGGSGSFDGTLTGPFSHPRVDGLFTGQNMRAWDTIWGDGTARVTFQNNYLNVGEAVIRLGDSEIRADGLFSMGYPRSDGGEEIDARIRVTGRDVNRLRHAFQIDDYPVSGRLSGEFHLTGAYQHPIGFGAMTIDDGSAYSEPFEHATATLRFDGAGIRLDGISISKGEGTVAGAAFVGWDSTYSFNADGRRIPAEQIRGFSYPSIQPTGLVEFTAGGSGTFAEPRYDVRFRVNDLYVASEGVGQVTGTMALRGQELSGEVDVASPRLAITGTGRISLAAQAQSELTFRFHDSSLNPYVRLFVPKLSPFTTAVASGSIHVTGGLANLNALAVEAVVDSVDLRLFDYAIHNAAPVRLALDRQTIRVDDLRLVGDETELRIGGTVALDDQRIALQANGEANLGILQGFFRDVRGSGRAELMAAVNGSLRDPVFSGSASIAEGRIRHFALPNALDAINGTIQFDSRGVRLDDVTATMGGGRVQFGGRIGLEGYLPGELNVTVRGDGMRLRYPEGVRSTVDADLTVRGNVKAPILGGTVLVREAAWNRRIDPTGSMFDFSRSPSGGQSAGPAPPPTVPLQFDLELRVPSTLRIENNLARLVASADLQLRGTYDHPVVSGRAEVDHGEVIFEGRRYLVTKGTIEFTNPARIEPFFDVEAETRVRVPGQTYLVTIRAAGTTERLQPTLESDPPLPSADVLALLFSDVRRTQGTTGGPGDVELRALQNPNQRQSDILTTRATQYLANKVGSSEVGRVVEQTFGVDTFQLTPSLLGTDPTTTTTRVNPSARVTIGKRVSERVYLTFSRSLTSSINDQIILLEYDESDRLSWILSRNEDQTYAVEVRVRHSF